MNLVFFSTKAEGEARKIKGMIAARLRSAKLRSFRTLPALESYLHKFPQPGVAVLLAADEGELTHLAGFRQFFRQTHLILVLPDRSDSSLRMAESLSPLLICFRDGDFSEVAALLTRIRKLYRSRPDAYDPKRYDWSSEIPFLSGSAWADETGARLGSSL